MKIIILSLLVFIPTFAHSQSICDRYDEGLVEYLKVEETRISFKNKGGLFNGGVCWWHSRLQRSSAYLAIYHPEISRPTNHEAYIILKKLKEMKSYVVIPGFDNFLDFTNAYKVEAQKVLDEWQIEDGFINQQWIRGISGNHKLPANQMKLRIETIHTSFKQSKNPLWVMAQIKGITAHAFLILDMYYKNGYWAISVIDSNHPLKTIELTYHEGDESLEHPVDGYKFMIYTGFNNDLNKMNKIVSRACLGFDYLPLPDAEIEIK